MRIKNLYGKPIRSPGHTFMFSNALSLQKYSPSLISKYVSRKISKTDTCKKWSSNIKAFAERFEITPDTIQRCRKTDSKEECWSRFTDINDFFTRKRIGLPPNSKEKDYYSFISKAYATATSEGRNTKKNILLRTIVSPADNYCVLLDYESIYRKVWIKGKYFTTQKLFNRPDFDQKKNNLLVFRLEPHHYHRFHFPLTGRIRSLQYVGNQYYSVNPKIVNSSINVFNENVRLIVEIENYSRETIFMAIIGATCVGSIEITHPNLVSILKKNKMDPISFKGSFIFKTPVLVKMNDELGVYKFGGSTIVLSAPLSYTLTNIGKIIKKNTEQNFETEIQVGDVILTQ